MNKIKLAEILSVVLGPQMWVPAVIFLIFFNSNLTSAQIKFLLPLTLVLQAILPILYIYIALKFNKITAWDIPIRSQRYLFLLFVLICNIVSLLIINLYGNPLLLELNLIMFAVAILMAFITLFWKISIHASINTLGPIYINYLLGFNLPILYLAIPIIIWARYTLGRHTIPQLLAGSFITALTVIMMTKLF